MSSVHGTNKQVGKLRFVTHPRVPVPPSGPSRKINHPSGLDKPVPGLSH